MKSLPIGFQSIENIITQGFTYVDKTGILHEIVKKKGYYFFSRPRRFGKSLTCSTLEAIFQGRKELFDGLEISKLDYDWKKYPIIRLDFSGISHQTIDNLNMSLCLRLDQFAENNKFDLSSNVLAKDKFRSLIIALSKMFGPVVVIIDEYDKPILDHIHDKDMALKMRTALKDFYGVFKDADVDSNLRFLFLTGVSKFSKVSIFSELNNLKDLTMDERVATLCGYTQEELETVFDEHIKEFATHTNRSVPEMLTELKNWYNGFKFSTKGQTVYNPFSILNSLQDKDFRNYWFSSGTPTFMMKFVEKNPDEVKKLIMMEASQLVVNDLEKLSIENYFENMLVLFVQAGYLTISEHNEKKRLFNLSYPNFEVRLSMSEQILELVTHLESVKIAGFIYRFQEAIENDNIEDFCLAMKDFLILLPHSVIINREKFYHGIFFTVAKLIGAKINSEEATNRGFIDAVLQGKKNIFIIEFKKDKTPDIALAQIEDKEYFRKFEIERDSLSAIATHKSTAEVSQERRRIVLVGINFDYEGDSGVTINWKIKNI